MARHETRAGVCFPGTGIAHRREPECRAPMFGSKLKHRKENRHHEKLHTPQPEPVQSQITIAPAGSKSSVLFVGLDVHNDSIAVSLAPSDSTEVRRYGIIGGEHDDVLKLVKKTSSRPSGGNLEVVLRSRATRLCPVPVPAGARAGLYLGLSIEGAGKKRVGPIILVQWQSQSQ